MMSYADDTVTSKTVVCSSASDNVRRRGSLSQAGILPNLDPGPRGPNPAIVGVAITGYQD